MIEGCSVLAVIPARGGSKGLPRKNIRMLCGRPLIEWTISAAQNSKFVDQVFLSSDDDDILNIARDAGCDLVLRRPDYLATDSARTIQVLHNVLNNKGNGYDFVVLLQPTSPLRIAEDIDGALRSCLSRGAPSCVSVSPVVKSPHWMMSISDSGLMEPILTVPEGVSRRQDMVVHYELNGAIYLAQTNWIVKRDSFISENTIAYVMPQERSLDIDGIEDWVIAEMRIGNDVLPKEIAKC